jgi:hypothetical protein
MVFEFITLDEEESYLKSTQLEIFESLLSEVKKIVEINKPLKNFASEK